MPNSPLCPSTALLGVVLEIPKSSKPCPLFSYKGVNENLLPLIVPEFSEKLQSCISSLDLSPELYFGHSFRRGRASYGHQCGLPVDLMKVQGDWSSNCVERYLQSSLICENMSQAQWDMQLLNM